MNNIRQIRELNKRELEAGISPEASWHADYRDTAYVYIGGLPAEFSEGDVLTIFSQYGEPTYINLVREKETGKSKGFAFLKYEDQRSTDLAVDNLGGAVVQGAQGSRTLRVDHTRYKKRDDKPDEGIDLTGQNTFGEPEKAREDDDISEDNEERPMLKEEVELAKLIREHDDDDPMKAFLIEEKKEEVKLALEVTKKRSKRPGKDRKTSHGHRSHRTRERDHQIEDGHSTHRPRKIDHRSNQESSRRHRRDSRSRSRSRDNGKKDRHGRDGDSAPRHHSRRES